MNQDYHGVKPVTEEDAKIAKKHLKDTAKLAKKKIKDHAKLMKKSDNPKSVAYNRSHLQNHQKEVSSIQKSLSTLSNMKGQPMAKFKTKKTGSTGGKSNALGGGGRFKQMTQHGMSPALAAYIGRKKYGASAMAKMSAKAR